MMKMIKPELVFSSKLSYEDYLAIVELDRAAYGDSIFTNPERTIARFEKCPDCFIRVYIGGKLAGAMSNYPASRSLTERAYNNDTLVDDDVRAEEIVPLSMSEVIDLMNFDIVVSEEYRGIGIGDMLLRGFGDFIAAKKAEGYSFGKLFGFAVSDGGRGVLKKHGAVMLKELRDGSGTLFELDLRGDRYI